VNENTEELMLDLLCKQAIYGLSEEETRQLHSLGVDPDDSTSLEATAAMIAMAGLDASEPMPAHLLAKISDSADEYFDQLPANKGRYVDMSSAPAAAPRRSIMDWLGWAVAAAACVALAVNIYLTRGQSGPQTAVTQPTPVVKEQLTPAQLRQQLIDSAPDVVRAEVAGLKDYSGVAGDIVWSESKQAGFMRFRNLPVNDKSKETYQLWIFDEPQLEKYPIDGGTFDVDQNGEVVVPIDARLRPKHPAAFAVTVEKPGGVVVSDREKIAAIGKTQA
jgi:hypothetical protein